MRELRNKVERAAMLVRAGQFSDTISGIGEVKLDEPFPFREAKAGRSRASSASIRALLERARGNISEAARLASMDRVHLTRLLQKARLGER